MAAGTEAAGAAAAGTAAAAGGLGAFGAIRIASNSSESRESSAIEDVIDRDKSTETEEPTPIEEALEQYRIIISQADSYEYENSLGLEPVGYQYALVQMQPDDPVPTLLLKMNIQMSDGGWFIGGYVRVFQYDPDTEAVRQPTETMMSGSERSDRDSLAMAEDRDGIISMYWNRGSGHISARILP